MIVSFWLNEQKMLTHIRWLSPSLRISFLAGMLGLMSVVWLFFLFLPQRAIIKMNVTKQQALQQTIGVLSSQLARYEKLALLVSNNLGMTGSVESAPTVRWVDAFGQIVTLLGAEYLTCKKITMLKDTSVAGINGKIVEYVFTGRYAHTISFLEKIQHQFSFIQIIQLHVDKTEKHAVLVTLKLCLLDV